MPAFLNGWPVWALVVAGAILAYLGYRYWAKHKKATAVKAQLAKVSNIGPNEFTSPRDNPENGGGA